MIDYSDDPERLNIGRVHGWLASSYWSPGIARETVERAIANSHCLGAYGATGQLGFARMITDRATFAWLADVWVDESVRGQGIGQAMVRWFLNHPDYDGLRRIGLTTADAHGVYEKLGFHALLRQERYMERLDPTFSAMLKATHG
ncbi:MAG: GNAT family N-acetyltransferase [Sphingobium sp.]|nr:GNAT family N-acetyltransferase [Sphingobium sp.]